MASARSKSHHRRRVDAGVIALVIIVCVLAAPITVSIVISLQNDAVARSVKDQLISLPLPPDSTLIDSYSEAGKLVGNGNGMQYLGAILIQSELSTTELESHYQAQATVLDEARVSEYPVTITVERGNATQLSEIRSLSGFLAEADQAGRYVVYEWGYTSSWVLKDWDLRGH
ncbi:hypothetical protein [Microbacterium sp.]|uniref:hypothetical protein n=1 Tax=Microbacterium sp. TaxID=51671 RepID=UPI0039E32B25